MTRSLLCTLTLFLSGIASANSILSVDWSNSGQTLYALTEQKILILKDGSISEKSGPNAVMRDATLFENDTKLLVGSDNGAFVNDLTMDSWTERNQGLENNAISFVFTNVELQNVLYAATQDTVYKLTPDDSGWVNMDIGPGGEITDYLHSNMPDSMDTGWIFASSTKGIAFTADCFCFWRDVRNFSHNVQAIAYQPESPSTYYAITEKMLFTTTDGARTWTEMSNVPFSDATSLVAAGLNNLFAGTESGSIWSFDRNSSEWKKVY